MCPVEISEEPQQQSTKELEEQVEYVNADVTEEEVEEHKQLQEGNSVGGENEIECKTKLPLAEDGPDVIEGEEAVITTVAEHHAPNWKKQLRSWKKRPSKESRNCHEDMNTARTGTCSATIISYVKYKNVHMIA